MSTASITRLGLDSKGVRMTPEEFDAVEDWDDQYRYELIDGVVSVNAIPSEAEAHPNDYLGGLLFVYSEFHPEGKRVDATMQERFIHFPNHRRRVDRVVWVGLGRLPDPKVDVPAIAVEFVSAGTRSRKRDYETKRDEYLAVGVREYWVIDRFDRTLTVFRNTDDGHSKTVVNEEDDYSTELLPGLELPLDKLLAVADRWENKE
jgi:Uma2 family endonuclease